MGFSHDAYVAYGVRIPIGAYQSDDEGLYPSEVVDLVLSVPTVKAYCPDVGHLQAGSYDEDFFFLVTKCDSAALGEYTRITYEDTDADWDIQLERVVEVAGWRHLDLEPASWFVVADMS